MMYEWLLKVEYDVIINVVLFHFAWFMRNVVGYCVVDDDLCDDDSYVYYDC